MNKPTLSIYHPNARNTGAAIRIALVKPRPIEGSDDFSDGYLELTIAPQATAGELPTFDWDNGIDVPIYFTEMSMMLAVFRGVHESIQDGKGVWISRPNGERIILHLHHIIEPLSGYLLEVFQKKGNDVSCSAHILLSDIEAFGLCSAIESSIGRVAFGD